MTLTLTRTLWLWAGALVLMLVLAILPLTPAWRVFAALATVAGVALALNRSGRLAACQGPAVGMTDEPTLPPASYRHPVVLVCGDSLHGLFGDVPAAQLAMRVTDQGCYVRVPELEQLPAMVAGLLGLRPDWPGRLSLMFVVNPLEHRDTARLAGRLRGFCHQRVLASKGGLELPLLVVSYIPATDVAGAWFSWESGQAGTQVREQGACTDLGEWQRQAVSNTQQMGRLHASVQLNSAAVWLRQQVLAYLNADADGASTMRPLACAITLVPVASSPLPGNVWQQWLHARAGLAGSGQGVEGEQGALPFPDALLHLFPMTPRRTHRQRAAVIAVWMFTMAVLLALGSSAWQNSLLARQVTDDLRRYGAIVQPHSRDQPEFNQQEQALAALQQDADRLDRYYRQGAPWTLGLGLYRGDQLRRPVLARIAGHRSLPMADAPLRLDSLSLFSTGSAQLKPESSQVLVHALMGIKARPGGLIVIAGHTDASGSAEHNLQLSRARAAAVRDWLKHMSGLPDSCFAVQGFGASQPIASNDTETGRTANRRVDIRLVPEAEACVLLETASSE